jgi:hypothetical protein
VVHTGATGGVVVQRAFFIPHPLIVSASGRLRAGVRGTPMAARDTPPRKSHPPKHFREPFLTRRSGVPLAMGKAAPDDRLSLGALDLSLRA